MIKIEDNGVLVIRIRPIPWRPLTRLRWIYLVSGTGVLVLLIYILPLDRFWSGVLFIMAWLCLAGPLFLSILFEYLGEEIIKVDSSSLIITHKLFFLRLLKKYTLEKIQAIRLAEDHDGENKKSKKFPNWEEEMVLITNRNHAGEIMITVDDKGYRFGYHLSKKDAAEITERLKDRLGLRRKKYKFYPH